MQNRLVLLAVLAWFVGCGSSPSGVALPTDTPSDSATNDIALDTNEPEISVPDTATEDSALPPADYPPCVENADCESGWCIEGPDGGKVCTEQCVQACPEGWKCEQVDTLGNDFVFICVPRWLGLCRPCMSESDCSGSSDLCRSYGEEEGSFCATPCLSDDDCPEDDYTCQDDWCARSEGACPCDITAVKSQAQTACSATNELGTCSGHRMCSEEGLSDCDAPDPTVEVCDGLDNDCDEAVDEDTTGQDCTVDNEHGSCAGGTTCEAATLGCDAPEPAPEICDGLDNNCDGETDEELGTTDCGQGACTHTTDNCVNGQIQACDAFKGATGETCNGIDDDCDGNTDEELGSTTCGLGQCNHTVNNCVDAAANTCNPMEGAAAETCNGIDDDCDGNTDEELGTTTCGKGICAQSVANCDNGASQTCDPMAGAQTETCNGIDDDCDGQTDEDLGSTTCGKGACAHTVQNCAGGSTQTCDAFEGATGETCNGIDDDCDGNTDEELGSTTCGKGLCNHTVNNCAQGAANTCNPMEGAAAETCNGIDDDCDGNTDEGLGSTSCGKGICAHSEANCANGALQTCDPMEGAQVENCNGSDDDCDGQVDEGLGSTTCGKGICVHTAPNCIGGVAQTCDPTEGSASEKCNGADDDCDGETDENFPNTDGDAQADCMDNDDDNDGDPDKADCAPLNPNVHHAAVEICNNGIDDNCDGKKLEGTLYQTTITITNSASTVNDAVVRVKVTNGITRAHMQAQMASLRIFKAASNAPFATPYKGVPYYVEENTNGSLILWVRLNLPKGTTKLTAYYGPKGQSPVSSGQSVFTYFNDFNEASDMNGWKLSSNYPNTKKQELLSSSLAHSKPSLLHDYMQAPGGACLQNRYAYSQRTITLPKGGNHIIAFYARTKSCTGCTMRHRFFLDGAQIHNGNWTSGPLLYRNYIKSLSKGSHSIQFGIYTENICSGLFAAYTDDIMIGPSPSPAPSTSVAKDTEADCNLLP